MNIYLVLAISGDCVVSLTAFLDVAKAFEYAAEARKTLKGSPAEITIQIATVTVGWNATKRNFLGWPLEWSLVICGAQENAEGVKFNRPLGGP